MNKNNSDSNSLNIIMGIICIGMGLLFFSVSVISGVLVIGAGIFCLVYRPQKSKKAPTTEDKTANHQNTSGSTTDSTVEKASSPQPDPTHDQNKVSYYFVAGVKYYLDNLMKLSYHNAYYDQTKQELIDCCMVNEKVWEKNYFAENIGFHSEPENPHDPNAIRVEIENLHVGYIPAHRCAEFSELIASNRILSVSCEISGGKYKCVDVDYSDSGREIYTLDQGEEDYDITLIVKEKCL